MCNKLFPNDAYFFEQTGDKPKDLIFLLTDRYNVMILECLTTDDHLEIITRAHGNVADMLGGY